MTLEIVTQPVAVEPQLEPQVQEEEGSVRETQLEAETARVGVAQPEILVEVAPVEAQLIPNNVEAEQAEMFRSEFDKALKEAKTIEKGVALKLVRDKCIPQKYLDIHLTFRQEQDIKKRIITGSYLCYMQRDADADNEDDNETNFDAASGQELDGGLFGLNAEHCLTDKSTLKTVGTDFPPKYNVPPTDIYWMTRSGGNADNGTNSKMEWGGNGKGGTILKD
uniref:Uncharacterized protein n=1 Tax=Romanomermis culicivorax TaxID=13658 RepID=A0A915HY65_ROMCU